MFCEHKNCYTDPMYVEFIFDDPEACQPMWPSLKEVEDAKACLEDATQRRRYKWCQQLQLEQQQEMDKGLREWSDNPEFPMNLEEDDLAFEAWTEQQEEQQEKQKEEREAAARRSGETEATLQDFLIRRARRGDNKAKDLRW